ncbi:L-histidine N(alpha)-methyltransferase [Actinoplanes sp. HUAS TT8]|uniref:L-histidine N(alpha)-methyltransferase n=1 Tax=Actinoplanes sp. HUAS TT8 TaxID=3447453 RepID=UPI003F51AD9E
MTFTPEELDELAAHLAATGEIDSRFSYRGDGAAAWDRLATWQQHDPEPNALHATHELLRDAHEDLVAALPGPIRVVDLGPGNGSPILGLLQRLLDAGRLERYVGVDVSPDMIEIARSHLRARLGPDPRLEFHCRDFTGSPLDDLRGTATMVLLLGGTLLNFADPAAVLRHLRPAAEVIVYTGRTDAADRPVGRFSVGGNGEDIPDKSRRLLDRLGVPRDRYEPEIGFDAVTRERFLRIHLTGPVLVANRVPLPAGRTVQLWRYQHRSADELIAMRASAGYGPLGQWQTRSGEFVLVAGREGVDGAP